MKFSDLVTTISVNYFSPERTYLGTVVCLPKKRYQLVLPSGKRELVPDGAEFSDAAQMLFRIETDAGLT